MKKLLLRFALVLAVLLAASALFLASAAGQRSVEAARLLAELAASGDAQSALRPMLRAPLSYEVDGRRYEADVYRPLAPPRMGMVLIPGASATGKDDPRLVEFAAWLAGARFVVLVPDVERLRRLQLRVDIIDHVVDALRYASASPSLAPHGKVGVVALSVAAGPALLAARAGAVRESVAFVLAIGGYHDLLATLTFSITGHFRVDGEWRRQEPKDLGKWVFVLSNAGGLEDPGDRRVLAAMARRRLENQDPAVLAPRLGPEGRAVYRFISNTDPERSHALFAQLPPAVVAEVEALSPSKQDLSALQAKVILVHGRDDPIIPYTESIALERALPQDRASLFLVDGLHHVDLNPGLMDGWRLWRVIYAVLAARDHT